MEQLLNEISFNLKIENESGKENETLNSLVEQLVSFPFNEAIFDQKLKNSLFEIIAELAKIGSYRAKLSIEQIVAFICHEFTMDQDDMCKTNAMRSLGNICFDNDIARALVANHLNFQSILYCSNQIVAFGSLFNMINENADSCKKLAAESEFKTWIPSCPLNRKFKILLNLIEFCDFNKEDLLWIFNELSCFLQLKDEDREDCEECLKYLFSLPLMADLVLENHKIVQPLFCEPSLVSIECLLELLLRNDDIMKNCFNFGWENILISWLSCGDDEIIYFTLLALGNVARCDENASRLVQHGLIDKTENFLLSENVKIRLGTLGLYKNLAIKNSHKNLFAKFIKSFQFHSLTIQEVYLAVGITRSICLQESNIPYVVPYLKDLEKAFSRFYPDNEAISTEIGRIFAMVSKFPDYKNELLEAEYFNIIIAMVKSKHEIIVCEALKSLAMFNIPLNAAMIEQISEHCKEHPNAEIRQLAEALK